MSIANAIHFMDRVQKDSDFRMACYKYKTHSELKTFLDSEGYKFDELEFENGFNSLHMKCQSESQAFELHQIKFWYQLFQ